MGTNQQRFHVRGTEDEADLTALSTGWTGDMTKCMRAMGANLVRSMRLNIKFAYLHSLKVDGKPPKDATAITEKEQKKYLKKRDATIYQQCNFCGCDDIAAHQQNIEEHDEYLTRKENDLLDPLGLDTSYAPIQHDKHDPARATVLHSMTCQRPELKAAREMGNDHIEDILELLSNGNSRQTQGATNNHSNSTNTRPPHLSLRTPAKNRAQTISHCSPHGKIQEMQPHNSNQKRNNANPRPMDKKVRGQPKLPSHPRLFESMATCHPTWNCQTRINTTNTPPQSMHTGHIWPWLDPPCHKNMH